MSEQQNAELSDLRTQLSQREAEIERLRQLLDNEQTAFASYELKLKADLAAAVKVIEAARGGICNRPYSCDKCDVVPRCFTSTRDTHEALRAYDAAQKGRTE